MSEGWGMCRVATPYPGRGGVEKKENFREDIKFFLSCYQSKFFFRVPKGIATDSTNTDPHPDSSSEPLKISLSEHTGSGGVMQTMRALCSAVYGYTKRYSFNHKKNGDDDTLTSLIPKDAVWITSLIKFLDTMAKKGNISRECK